jgi:hypothetical protein
MGRNIPGKSGSVKNLMGTDCGPADLAYLAGQCMPTSRTKSKSSAESNSSDASLGRRDQVKKNLIGGNSKTRNLTRNGNNNTVEVYIAGSGVNFVNVTVSLEADDHSLKDSNNNNVVKGYVGEAHRVNMGNSTVVAAERKEGERDCHCWPFIVYLSKSI